MPCFHGTSQPQRKFFAEKPEGQQEVEKNRFDQICAKLNMPWPFTKTVFNIHVKAIAQVSQRVAAPKGTSVKEIRAINAGRQKC